MSRGTRLAWLMAGLAALRVSGASAVDDGAGPVVIELFTSQGCSSCPAADALVSRLGLEEARLERALSLPAEAGARGERTIDLKPGRGSLRANLGVAALLQDPATMRIYAAAVARVEPGGEDEWGVAPGRVGLLGPWSSGARLDPGRPSFAGLVYGAPFGAMPAIPNELPRAFMAWAQDDGVARAPAARFRDALLAAGHRPEVRAYGAGGHGFGLRQLGTASDRWIDDFLAWLRTLISPARSH